MGPRAGFAERRGPPRQVAPLRTPDRTRLVVAECDARRRQTIEDAERIFDVDPEWRRRRRDRRRIRYRFTRDRCLEYRVVRRTRFGC